MEILTCGADSEIGEEQGEWRLGLSASAFTEIERLKPAIFLGISVGVYKNEQTRLFSIIKLSNIKPKSHGNLPSAPYF